MNEPYQRIILISDGTETSDTAEATAINIATEHGASILVVDTIRPRPALSKWLSDKYENHFDEFVADKQVRIEQVGERIKQAGVSCDVEILFGKSSESIVRKALVENADLLIRYMKGARSTRIASRFGTTAMNLMRVCPCPLLLVGDKPISNPKVLACVDAEHGVAENKIILNAARQLASDVHHLLAIYCWYYDETEFRKTFEADKLHPEKPSGQTELNLYREEVEKRYSRIYEKFVEQHDLSSFPGGLHLENGKPRIAIPELCQQEGVDVAVMSSASLNHPLNLLLGSTVEAVIEKLPCSLLVVKPAGFISPVRIKSRSDAAIEKQSGLKSKQKVFQSKAHVTVFDDLKAAQNAVESLHQAGFPLTQIELITSDADERINDIETPKSHETTGSSLVENATKWGSVGAAAGSLSIVFAPFPGFVLGAIAVGGVTGAIIGGMAGVEHAVDDATVDLPSVEDYERLVRQGNCLVVVHGTHQEILKVESVVKGMRNVQTHILTLHGHEFHEHTVRTNEGTSRIVSGVSES